MRRGFKSRPLRFAQRSRRQGVRAAQGRPDFAPSIESCRPPAAAAAFTWRTPGRKPQYPLYLAGVARGDVYRVVLHARGIIPRTLYTRGTTWGEFSSASGLSQGGAFLAIYGRHGLVQKLPVDVAPGQQRVIQ
ncbi:MAG TPA: hypothetical protein VIK38_05750 [Coriobacteriia bacterium]